MIDIITNTESLGEKEYIFHQIFERFLGIDYRLKIEQDSNLIEIRHEAKSIILDSYFFSQFNSKDWLSIESLPVLPLGHLNDKSLKDLWPKGISKLPILYGNGSVALTENSLRLGVDIFGSIFFMLSRYEELVIKEKDIHGRFPYKESIAYKEGLIMRPIVDEYIEFLWHCMSHFWPMLTRKRVEAKTFLSCDVDYLKDKGVFFPGIIKRLVGDLLKWKSISKCFGSLKLFYNVCLLGDSKLNPFNTFDFMMDECDKKGMKMAFYFIPLNNKQPIDGDYNIESEEVMLLMKKIIKRGHHVGYHASYYSYNDLDKTLKEVSLLKKVYAKAGGDPEEIKGGRQHFLRWETGITEKNWEATGLKYDSTLGYAEHIGYRCGTTKEYEFYDCIGRKPLKLMIRPLIIMDCTLLEKKYMGLNHIGAMNVIDELTACSKITNGCNSVLWHNSYLQTNKKKDLFKKLIFQK